MQDNTKYKDYIFLLIKESTYTMPFSDFEETVMLRINIEVKKQKSPQRDRKWSCFFFISGTCFGLIINAILQKSDYSVLSISASTILLLFQITFVSLFLFQLEKYLPLFKSCKKMQPRD